ARDTRDAVAPPKSKETVAMPGTVSESELRLKTVAARREGNREGEVAGAGVRVRGELFADPVHGTAAGRQGKNGTRAVASAHAGPSLVDPWRRTLILIENRFPRSVAVARSSTPKVL